MTPLPQGFPIANRIENAATVRLTDSGLQFLSQNLPSLVNSVGVSGLMNGVFQQAIPPTDQKVNVLVGNVTVKVCDPMPSDPTQCNVEVDIGKSMLTIATASPHELTVTGNLLVRIRDVTVTVPTLFGDIHDHVTLSHPATCDPASTQFAPVPINIKVPVITDTDPTHGTRAGLSRIGQIAVDLNIDQNDISICGDNIGGDILGFLAGLFKSTLVSQLTGPLQDQINKATCLKANPNASPQCPDPAMPDGSGVCKYADGTCAAMALGTEGTIDIGHMLASISPATTGGLDFLFAVGGQDPNPNAPGNLYGDLNPINNGATLAMVGGAEADPVPPVMCGPKASLTLPTGIPTPDELLANTVSGWPAGTPGPHLGVAISERFANYALGGVYNSGALCIQITGDDPKYAMLSALTAAVQSMGPLQWHAQPAPLGVVLRPSQPPTVAFGNGTSVDTDPTLRVGWKVLNVDFYVWSSDRYVRTFTYTADLDVPVNLDVGPDGLTPVVGKVTITNSKVTNTKPLLSDDPKAIQGLLDGALSALAPMLAGGIKPISLASLTASLGVGLVIPPSVMGQGSPGVRKLTKDSDKFLGIFGSLEQSMTMVHEPIVENHTFVELGAVKIDRDGLLARTARPDNGPVVHVFATSSLDDGSHPVEYAYRVDSSAWHAWVDTREIVADDPLLRFQGRHAIYVKSRIVGQPRSEDRTPPSVQVVVDADPPALRIREDGDKIVLEAWDRVSHDEDLLARYQVDGGTFSEWMPYEQVAKIAPANARVVTFEVRDESGKVGTISHELRGRVDNTGKTTSSSCGCSVPGQSSPSSLPFAGFVAASVLAWSRWSRRRKAAQLAATAAVVGTMGSFSGCNCGAQGADSTDETPPGEVGGHGGSGGAGGMSTGGGGSGGTSAGGSGCGTDCGLVPGLVGAYTSTAVASDGTIWVAGYNEADYDDKMLYGDLVVGKWDASKKAVDWKTVDGTDPNETVNPDSVDPNGWRGGKKKPGDDVGLWTSMQLDDKGNPMVAYWDATHGALKFAHFDGSAWKIHQVDQKDKSQIGKYAKMVLVNKAPVIAYLSMEPGSDGFVVSKVKVARAKSATPASNADWTFEEVTSNPKSPCRASFCAMGAKCNSVSLKCEMPAKTCMPSCGAGTDCFTDPMTGTAACQKLYDASKHDSYPDATGLYVSAALTPKGDVGLVYYDRIRGNLWMAQKSGSMWQNTLLDGQTPGDPGMDTGDVGIGASLAIDKMGNWHISYVDGIAEAVKYMQVPMGSGTPTTEFVDNGMPITGGQPFTDGPHIVGDDSSITVDASGAVHIAYMDATGGTLRYATRTGANAYQIKEFAFANKFAGFFSQQVVVSGKTQLGTWWRQGQTAVEGDVVFVQP